MSNTISFDELVKTYQYDDELFVEVSDSEHINALLKSKLAPTWCQRPIENSGWFILATYSPPKIGKKTSILVCKQEFVNDESIIN